MIDSSNALRNRELVGNWLMEFIITFNSVIRCSAFSTYNTFASRKARIRKSRLSSSFKSFAALDMVCKSEQDNEGLDDEEEDMREDEK